MLDIALIGSALLMGAAGSVHCVAMCAAPCAAVTRGQGASTLAFQGGRMASYALAGAVAASSVGLLWQWEQAAAWLRPVWLALHLAVLALGLFLLWRGEQPGWMQRRWGQALAGPAGSIGTTAPNSASGASGASTSSALATPFQVIPIVPAHASGAALQQSAASPSLRSAAAGLAWVAWPCGLLQSALLVAALASGPVQGAGVMAAFALGSSPGLVAGPWLLRRLAVWQRGRPGRAGVRPDLDGGAGVATGVAGLRWATRLSGLLLASAALWALGHGLWLQIRAYCG